MLYLIIKMPAFRYVFADPVTYGIVACALVAYRVDQELASRANPVVFRRCIVEVGREEQNYFRERSHLDL